MKTPAQILEGWSLNSIVSMQSGLPWGVNDLTTDFSGTGAINAQASVGERWNFFGNPDDFKTTKTLLNTNGGQGGIPYFPKASNADCLAKAQAAGPLAVASLTNLGCYANGGSVLIPPAYGSYSTLGRSVFRSMPYYKGSFSDESDENQGTDHSSVPGRILQRPQSSEHFEPVRRTWWRPRLHGSFSSSRYQLWLPAPDTRCHEFESRARIRRSPRDPVGAEDNFLI